MFARSIAVVGRRKSGEVTCVQPPATDLNRLQPLPDDQQILCLRRSAASSVATGGQGVAGSNPVSPTGDDGPLIWMKHQVNGLFLCLLLILIACP
jgi:hypothetical protein